MGQNFRIGVIGLGGVADAHLSAYRALQHVRVVSVCDLREDVARSTALRLSANAYTDYRALLSDGGLDLALVLTPASTHREIVEAAAQAGIHVLCEKPLALSLADGHAMADACRLAGVKLFYGSCYRYLPAVRTAFELIRAGAIGRLILMSEQIVGGGGAAAYKELGPVHYPVGGLGGHGMGLVDHGVHLIDVFSWLAGAPPQRVVGSGQIAGAAAQTEYMIMSFPNGAIGQLLYNGATFSTTLPNEGLFSGGQGWLVDGTLSQSGEWEAEPGSISIYGTEGSMRVFHYANALYLKDRDGQRRIELEGRPAFGHFASQLEDCMDSISVDREPTVGAREGLEALRVVASVYADDISAAKTS